MVDLDKLLPAGDAAIELRMSRERLIRKVQLGEIAGRKVAGVWMVERESVTDYQRRCSDEPAPAA